MADHLGRHYESDSNESFRIFAHFGTALLTRLYDATNEFYIEGGVL